MFGPSSLQDQGISVRKRAIRALWECCSCPGFSRATDAVLAVLKRANDKEDSMKSLVTKICGDMWFLEGSSFAGVCATEGSLCQQSSVAKDHISRRSKHTDVSICRAPHNLHMVRLSVVHCMRVCLLAGLAEGEAQPSSAAAVTRTAAVRAGELAALSLQLYEASGKTIHVPLAADHGLIVIFKEVLGTAGSSSAAAAPSAKELKEQLVLRQGAADMAEALLNMTLQHHQQVSFTVKPVEIRCGLWPCMSNGRGLGMVQSTGWIVAKLSAATCKWSQTAFCSRSGFSLQGRREARATCGLDLLRLLLIITCPECAANCVQETADDSLGSDSGGGGCFQYLLALHILTAADPSVAAPAADPQRFVRFLAPYTSALANTAAPAQLARMSSGEEPPHSHTQHKRLSTAADCRL